MCKRRRPRGTKRTTGAAPSAARRSWVLRGVERGVVKEARTRGFAAPALAGCALVDGLVQGSRPQARRRLTTAPPSGMTTPARYYVNRATPAWARIPMLLPAEESTSNPSALAGSQVRLLNALARPILVADETGRLLYQTPTLRECLDHISVQERNQLERALDHAVTHLCSRLRNQSDTAASTRPVVLSREVLTNRSEFRLRGVLLPAAVLLNRRGILLELERMGKRKVHMEDLCVQVGLTAREMEVATLIARGLSDQAIATRLGISSRTAEHHTEHVLRKLSVDRRSAVAALLAR